MSFRDSFEDRQGIVPGELDGLKRKPKESSDSGYVKNGDRSGKEGGQLSRLEAAKKLLENMRRAKRGESIAPIESKGLSEEDRNQFERANKGIEIIRGMKEAKNASREASDGEKEKTKICQWCGDENSMKASFCGNCGGKFEVSKKDKQEALSGDKDETMELNFGIMTARNRNELFEAIEKIDYFHGSDGKIYSSSEMLAKAKEVLDSGNILERTKVTRSLGLRDKVREILLQEMEERYKKNKEDR